MRSGRIVQQADDLVAAALLDGDDAFEGGGIQLAPQAPLVLLKVLQPLLVGADADERYACELHRVAVGGIDLQHDDRLVVDGQRVEPETDRLNSSQPVSRGRLHSSWTRLVQQAEGSGIAGGRPAGTRGAPQEFDSAVGNQLRPANILRRSGVIPVDCHLVWHGGPLK